MTQEYNLGTAGPAFYEDVTVFATYQQRRQRTDNPNDTLEKPVILELIGAIAGKHVLDLGCGDAVIGRELLQTGAAAYLGIDGSANMAALATQTLAGTGGRVIHQSILWLGASQCNPHETSSPTFPEFYGTGISGFMFFALCGKEL